MIMRQIFPLSLLICFIAISFFSGINNNNYFFSYLNIDSFGICLSVIPIFILCCLYSIIIKELNTPNFIIILLSCFSSVVCFNSNNYMLFFISYELSIILLLFSLFIGSPYSERYLAGWYFMGYLVIGGIPLLLVCVYNSFYISTINLSNNSELLSYLLFILFITKVPLFPFHSWLPIVHAEANSLVSICLSGYIMKLGLLGVIRMHSSDMEVIKAYSIVFFLASCYFFISCFCELDNKRWLAFLSLGHISVGMVGTLSLSTQENYLLSSFSLGHALSVIFLFYFFSTKSDQLGSRNWVVLLNNNNSKSLLLWTLGGLSLVAFPPSILFFNEVFIFVSTNSNLSVNFIFYFYIFFSILGPICLISLLLSRLSNSSIISSSNINYIILICVAFLFYSYFLLI